MSIGIRILISILIGWAIAFILLLFGLNIEDKTVSSILLWNVSFFIALAGNGPLLGYDAQGNPMYEGTPVHIFFALFGLASGFLIYPIFVFLILTIVDKLYLSKKISKFDESVEKG